MYILLEIFILSVLSARKFLPHYINNGLQQYFDYVCIVNGFLYVGITMVLCGTFEELRHYCNLQIRCHSCHGYLCVAHSRIVLVLSSTLQKDQTNNYCCINSVLSIYFFYAGHYVHASTYSVTRVDLPSVTYHQVQILFPFSLL